MRPLEDSKRDALLLCVKSYCWSSTAGARHEKNLAVQVFFLDFCLQINQPGPHAALLCFFVHSICSISCGSCLTSSVAQRRNTFSCFCWWSILCCCSRCFRAEVKFLQLFLSLISFLQETDPQLVCYHQHPWSPRLFNEIFTQTHLLQHLPNLSFDFQETFQQMITFLLCLLSKGVGLVSSTLVGTQPPTAEIMWMSSLKYWNIPKSTFLGGTIDMGMSLLSIYKPTPLVFSCRVLDESFLHMSDCLRPQFLTSGSNAKISLPQFILKALK